MITLIYLNKIEFVACVSSRNPSKFKKSSPSLKIYHVKINNVAMLLTYLHIIFVNCNNNSFFQFKSIKLFCSQNISYN